MEAEKKIAPGDLVVIRYTVLTDTGVIDLSKEPVSLRVGEGRFFRPVEEGLIGRKEGEKVVIVVPPEEHYGRYDPKKVEVIPAEKIPPQARPGDTVFVQDELGVLHPAKLRRRDARLAVIDRNHPLAGKYLRFEVEILRVEKPNLSEEALPAEGGGI